MDSIKAAQKLHDEILNIIMQAQSDSSREGMLTDRATWIEAIKQAAPESFKKILLQHDIVIK